ncbi:BppU family phage baseplate upper protein [Pediococcus pentosaceus]|uniref:BppU family phage baseplate upper protein n=1 Tax=Pediococcus pentosaceus TaxID=1255 RepID=UPI00207363D3|nr:BppU family phage baseplate upper protein [Pediococcus pentosaceus]MCM6810521.1 BppU family phage baseplate upper protein [Pediococcus pentosaceus]
MSMYLTFTIGKDKRNLVDDITDFHIDNSASTNPQWLQARQNEDGMRQVFVTVKNEDGSPFNLTDCNYWFQGKLPDGIHKIIDARHGVTLDAQNGKFRFDMPKQAFTVAGSYVQAFFRIVRNGESLTTLEFDLTVLADLVYNDLVPSNYITPFEDLYGKLKEYLVKFNGDFDAAMAKWKKDVADLITELNADISGINLTITEIKTQLASLEAKIKADGLPTIADLTNMLNPIINRLDKLEAKEKSSDLLTDVGGGIRDIFTSQISNMKARINPDLVNIGMINDVHYTDRDSFWGPDNDAETGITHLLNIGEVSEKLDFAVSVGDNIDDNWGDNHFSIKRIEDYGMTWFTALECPAAVLLGNHDDNSSHAKSSGATGNDYLVPDSKFIQAYRQNVNLFGEKRNGNSNYFYYDIPNKKVRVVGINDYENPNTLDSDGKLKYPRINTSVITGAQLKWLATNALKVSADTHVIVMLHCPIDGTIKDNPAEHCYNHDVLKQLLEAFKNGTSGTLTSSTTDFPVNVDYNFASKGTLIGVFAGHTHTEEYQVINGINYVVNLNSVGCAGNAGNRILYFDTKDEDSWSVIGIDTANKKVKSTKFGRGTDLDFTY